MAKQKLPSLNAVLAQKNAGKQSGLPSLDSVVSKNGTKGLPSLGAVLNHKNAAKAAPKQHHGSLVGNLLHDTESAAANIVPGVVAIAEHPVRSAKQIGHQYADMYGPLVHGDFGKFYANVHAHPLQPLLDAATVATLGAGLAAKAGVLSADAAELTVPDIARQAGQAGEDVVIRKSSTNPVIRARQVAINKALNKARPDVPVVGSQARFARTIAGRSLKEGQALALKGNAFKQSFGRLSNAERAAWHLKARQLDPAAYTRLLESGAVKEPASTEVAMTRRLQDKSLNEVYRNPTKKLQDALAKGRALADLMTAEKVRRGYVDDVAAAERPYLAQRFLHGATHDEEGNLVDLPGREIPSLAAELARRGEQQPFHVPDSAEAGKVARQSWKPEATAPMALKSGKQNRGILLRKGMLNLHHDSLGMEMDRFARHVQRTDVHGALMEHAAKVPETGLPEGWRILKTTAGQRSAPYTERAAGDLKRALAEPETHDSLLERFTSKDVNHPDAAVDGEGHKIMVPDRVAELLAHQAAPTKGLIRKILFNKPTSVWKHLVLGLRPAYFGNIVLSQHILGALQMAGGTRGVAAYLNHLIPGARLGKLTDATVEDVLPEQAHGTFSGTEGATSNKGLRVSAKAYQGVMPATLAVENWLRRLMIEGWAKSEPEVRAAMARHGGDVNAALRDVAKTDPHVLEEISRRVDHAQGNYRTYSPTEQKLRQIIPFYGWDRHIVQSTYRLLAERPALANAGYQTGGLGEQKTIRELGDLPTYLQGVVRLSGLPAFMGPLNGNTPVISTKAVGPFATDADILRTAESLVHGRAGTSPEEANNINPLIAAVVEQLTGRNLATGATLKDTLPGGYLNVPVRAALNLPQARLVEQLIGRHPLGQSKRPTSSPDWQSQLAAILGVPVKKLDLNAAHSVAGKQGQPPR